MDSIHAANDDRHAASDAAAKYTRGTSCGRPKSPDTAAGSHESGMNAEASHQRWTCFKGKNFRFVWRFRIPFLCMFHLKLPFRRIPHFETSIHPFLVVLTSQSRLFHFPIHKKFGTAKRKTKKCESHAGEVGQESREPLWLARLMGITKTNGDLSHIFLQQQNGHIVSYILYVHIYIICPHIYIYIYLIFIIYIYILFI